MVNPERRSQGDEPFAISPPRPNTGDVRLGQLRCAASFASRTAPLRISIGHIDGVCTKKEMVRIDTQGHVTAMKNIDAVRDRATKETPRHAMCVDFLSIDRHASVTASRRR